MDKCLAKFSGVLLDAKGGEATFEVALRLPAAGPCSDIKAVCLPGLGGDCQVALSDKQVSTARAAAR